MNFDYAIHSDFLIHWTGKDIDKKYDKPWYESGKSKTNKNCTIKYIKRLLDILEYGLWMTEETKEDEDSLSIAGKSVSIPRTPKTCFTELKLSESRKHAKQYGRLGIGVKRYFLFDRWGRPLIYYRRNVSDKFLEGCWSNLKDKKLLNFFKRMNRSDEDLTYDLYAESEWRILFFEGLLKEGLIKDPQDPKNEKENKYFNNELTPEEQAKLKYLIPLNGWFAMIIYPSLDVKNEAQKYREQNRENGEIKYKLNDIQKEIERIKKDKIEDGNWPIEVDLDACRNF